MTTLRDALSDAFAQSETGTLEAPVETAIEVDETPQAESSARARDELGRFAKIEEKAAEVAEKAPPKPDAPVLAPEPKPARKPPSSWKKDHWGRWERLATDPELSPLQDYIEEREGQFAKGVSQYKQQWEQVAPIAQAIQPFIPELQQYGVSPDQWISNLGRAHSQLVHGTPEQKLQAFAKLATDYGVPLQALTGQQADPQAGMLFDRFNTVEQQLRRMQQQQQQQEAARLTNQIEAFKQSAPHFEAVKATMAQLLESGVAPDLQTAYDKAIRLHDDVWQQVQAENTARAEAERAAMVAKKKAAAVSPRSNSPTGSMVAGGGKKDLRSQLSEAVDSVMGGRV